MSICVAPSLMASAVSMVFTSRRACDEGKLPVTFVMSTPSTSRLSAMSFVKQGYAQTAATCGRSGYSLSNLFTFSTIASTFSSVSAVLRVVSSTLPSKNFFTSRLSFSDTFSAIIFVTAAFTSSSVMLRLYCSKA